MHRGMRQSQMRKVLLVYGVALDRATDVDQCQARQPPGYLPRNSAGSCAEALPLERGLRKTTAVM